MYHSLGRHQVLGLLKENDKLEEVKINFSKELGRGSYGAVYEAEWRGLSCVAKVFHKIIFPNQPGDTWKQLAREIELLQNVRHPNIVQLLGFIPETQSKIPSIVMERLNTNLTKLIEKHYSLLSFDMQVCILHDVAVGLSFLHGHKEPIIHRDLSSNNILLTDHLVAKISDLGLAKHIKSAEQQTGSFTGFGTQDYMPPEVLGQKPPQISPKTDVFSFGVVMLQLATGKAPDVRGILNVDNEADRRKHNLELLSENSLLHPLVLQCLSNRSINRPTAVVLCEALKKIGVVKKSVLQHTKTLQEKAECIEKLEAFLLQKDSAMQKMKKIQEQLQQQTKVLHTKLDEEKRAALLKTKTLNDALSSKSELQKLLNAEKEVQSKLYAEIAQLKDKVTVATECQLLINAKQLTRQNQELTNLLENTCKSLNMYKMNFCTLKELFDSFNKEQTSVENITDKLQKYKSDGKHTLDKLQDMESRLLIIKQSLHQDKKVDSQKLILSNNYCSDTINKVSFHCIN